MIQYRHRPEPRKIMQRGSPTKHLFCVS